MSNTRNLSKLIATSNGKLDSSSMKAGTVIQTVTATTSTVVQSSSTTYIDFLTASITPQSVSNKILITSFIPFAVLLYQSYNGNRDEVRLFYQLLRNGNQLTEVHIEMGAGSWTLDGKRLYGNANLHKLDTPNTISPVTYTIQHMGDPSGVYGIFQSSHNNKASTLTLMEIAG